MNKIDYESSYPNKGGKSQLNEEKYYWIKSYMSSIYGMTKKVLKNLKNGGKQNE